MSKITCTRRLTFCAGHRVVGHENKCAHLHGHNYVVEVTAEAEALDSVGRVIDFSVLKEKVGGWIDEHWDHGFILYKEDFEAMAAMERFTKAHAGAMTQKVFTMSENPTAENLAKYLLEIVCTSAVDLGGIVVNHVRVWETENCYADAHWVE